MLERSISARSEGEAGQQHRATARRRNAHAVSDLILQIDHPVCVRNLDVLQGFESDVSQSYHNRLLTYRVLLGTP
jgi:hypothetical protein